MNTFVKTRNKKIKLNYKVWMGKRAELLDSLFGEHYGKVPVAKVDTPLNSINVPRKRQGEIFLTPCKPWQAPPKKTKSFKRTKKRYFGLEADHIYQSSLLLVKHWTDLHEKHYLMHRFNVRRKELEAKWSKKIDISLMVTAYQDMSYIAIHQYEICRIFEELESIGYVGLDSSDRMHLYDAFNKVQKRPERTVFKIIPPKTISWESTPILKIPVDNSLFTYFRDHGVMSKLDTNKRRKIKCPFKLLRIESHCCAHVPNNLPISTSANQLSRFLAHPSLGLMSLTSIERNSFIFELSGSIVFYDSIKRMRFSAETSSQKSYAICDEYFIIFAQDDFLVSCLKAGKNPNAEIQNWLVDGRLHAAIFTIKKLQPLEILSLRNDPCFTTVSQQRRTSFELNRLATTVMEHIDRPYRLIRSFYEHTTTSGNSILLTAIDHVLSKRSKSCAAKIAAELLNLNLAAILIDIIDKSELRKKDMDLLLIIARFLENAGAREIFDNQPGLKHSLEMKMKCLSSIDYPYEMARTTLDVLQFLLKGTASSDGENNDNSIFREVKNRVNGKMYMRRNR
ncbi:hypothetical protein ACOME3_002938 [Neoechinorhynchus agilis]